LSGSSGAGKTTILDLIIGLYLPTSGRVLAGQDSLSDLQLNQWRELIGYVPQDPILLHDSIRVNVTMGDQAIDPMTIEWALALAGASDFISKLDHGIDTSVGERGSHLSGGQRRRVCLARALVRKPKLLLIDEVTPGLDPKTEAKIVATLVELKSQMTVLAVTHQPALIECADVVYSLESGQATQLQKCDSPAS
jgi:ATP-binding cassette, subfamily C, bacterial